MESTTKKRKQVSLDSDEEDDEIEEEHYNVLDVDKFEGTEDGPPITDGNVEFTAFNLKEELQEGRFDKDGHYVWKKEKEIRDNWADNIDWVKIKPLAEIKKNKKSGEPHGLADSDSDSDDDGNILFDAIPLYKQILEYMKPGETVSRALCRLGGGRKRMTTAERWKRKKIPDEDKEKSDQITKLSELANELLTRTGNMDIYQESYEQIKKKVDLSGKQSHPCKQEAELDMYADDFCDKETTKLGENDMQDEEQDTESNEKKDESSNDSMNITWELKWSQEDNAEIHGPHTTEQMQAWAKAGYFKKGAWVRKNGQNQFYSASRIDFEIYI